MLVDPETGEITEVRFSAESYARTVRNLLRSEEHSVTHVRDDVYMLHAAIPAVDVAPLVNRAASQAVQARVFGNALVVRLEGRDARPGAYGLSHFAEDFSSLVV